MFSRFLRFVLLGTLFKGCFSHEYPGLLQSFCKKPSDPRNSEPSYGFNQERAGFRPIGGLSSCQMCVLSLRDGDLYAGEQKIGQNGHGQFSVRSNAECDVRAVELSDRGTDDENYSLKIDVATFVDVSNYVFVQSSKSTVLSGHEAQLALPKDLKPEEFEGSVAAVIVGREPPFTKGLVFSLHDTNEWYLQRITYASSQSNDILGVSTFYRPFSMSERPNFVLVSGDRKNIYTVERAYDDGCTFELNVTNGMFISARVLTAKKPSFTYENGLFIATATVIKPCTLETWRYRPSPYFSKALLKDRLGDLVGVFLDNEIHAPRSYTLLKTKPNGIFFAYEYEGFYFFSNGKNFYVDLGSAELLDGFKTHSYKTPATIKASCRGSPDFYSAKIHNDTTATITQTGTPCADCAIDTGMMHRFGIMKVNGKIGFYFVKNKVAIARKIDRKCSVKMLGITSRGPVA